MRLLSISLALISSFIITIASLLGYFSRAAIYANYNGVKQSYNISKEPLLNIECQEHHSKYSQLLNETVLITKEDYKNNILIAILGLTSFISIIIYIGMTQKSKN